MRLANLAFAAAVGRFHSVQYSPLGLWRISVHHAAPPAPPRLKRAATASPAVNMNTKTDSSSISARRHKAASAAERRLQSTTATANGGDTPAATASPVAAAGGKRKAHPRAGAATAQQVGFSDSDGSDSEVDCVGVSSSGTAPASKGKAAAATRGGRGRKGGDSVSSDGVGGARKRAREGDGAAAAEALGTSAGPGAQADEKETGGPRAPKTFRVVSWNIDCLNPENKHARVEEVCAIVLEECVLPDVILLQEVDAHILPVLNARLGSSGGYQAYPSRTPIENGYFTMVYARSSTVTVQASGREDFPGSHMGRDLTSVRCTFNGKQLLIMTSHLESEKQSSDERKKQFHQALRKLLGFREGPAIFAGDTNLREAEVKQEKLAKQTGDMWQLCGADSAIRFTWDMLKNDNMVFGGGFQPRARYDRMFVNPQAKVAAKSFALLGTERMAPPHSCFPSDHFGMDTRFEL